METPSAPIAGPCYYGRKSAAIRCKGAGGASMRKQCESDIYHVVCRGVGRQLIFEADEDRERFLDLLVSSAATSAVEILAWCLMGNHVHLLLRAPMSQISPCMQRVCGAYARAFNAHYERTGRLFQDRFKSEPVDDEAYFLVVASYIHFNPEKAGIAKQDEYRWSSYGEYAGRADARRICSTELVLGAFGSEKAFVAFHRAHAGERQCMDADALRSPTRPMRDGVALEIAEKVLEGRNLNELKTLDRRERNSLLGLLLSAGLSVRQIERLTGISRGIIQSVKPDK